MTISEGHKIEPVWLKPSKCCDSYDGMLIPHKPMPWCSPPVSLFRHSIAELRTRGNIYELGKVHLLALQSDAELLTETFNEELQRPSAAFVPSSAVKPHAGTMKKRVHGTPSPCL